MKRLISSFLCIAMLVPTSTVFASEVNSKNDFVLRQERVQKSADKITYANEQEGYDAKEYQTFSLKRDAIMNGDSGNDKEVINQVIANDLALLAEKERALKLEAIAMTKAVVDEFKTCNVSVFEQINGYYCGPATVKQVVHYINGSSLSQSAYASRLGTTTSGTDMTRITPVVNSEIGKNLYIYSTFSSFDEWFRRVRLSINTDYPAILDIDTRYVRAFPYRSSGHFVNVSGYDIYSPQGIHDVRITDPWGPGLGNKWYDSYDVYTANADHWRSAIIW